MRVHVAVCIKQVLDQEIPPDVFRVDRARLRADVPGAPLVMSIFDTNALEVALKLREAAGDGSTVTALSVGPPSAEDVLRKALAVTADQAVLLWDEGFDRLDPPGVATVLAAAVRRLRTLGTPVDVVLTGRQAGDWEHGQTGGMVAEALGWPCLTFVSQLRPAGDGDLEARREVEDGFQTILARPPVVVTVTNDATNRLRLAKVRDVLRAHRTPVPVWGRADLGLEGERLDPWTEVVDLGIPERDRRCEFLEGETPEEKATALVQRLRELRVL